MKLQNITPRLKVKSIMQTVQFYRDVLGFKIVYLLFEDNLNLEFSKIKNLAYHSAVISHGMVNLILERSSFFPLYVERIFKRRMVILIEIDNLEDFYLDLLNKEVEFVRHLKTIYCGVREIRIKDCNGYELIFREQL